MAGLRRAVEDAVGGRGRLVLISGEPGVGKTALVEYGCGYASDLGAAVAWGASWDGDGTPGFWPWQQVAAAVGADLDTLFASAPVAGSPEPMGEATQARRFQLFTAVADGLREAATRQPLIVVVDDLHWADAGAVRLLGFAARQLRRDRVLLVGAYREPDGPDTCPLSILPAEAEVLPLSGLDARATGELLRRWGGDRLAARFTATVHRRTGGNPFFITQLAPLLDTGSDGPADSPADARLPVAVGEAIRERLARLPHPTVDLLSTASVLGSEFDAALLSTVVGIGAAQAVARLEPAVRAGALVAAGMGRYRFAHDLVREYLYSVMTGHQRARTHLEVATTLRADGSAAPGDLARHYAQAVPAADPAIALDAIVTAAEHAGARAAYEEAARHWRQALHVAGLTGAVPLTLRLRAAEGLLRAGERALAWDGFVAAAHAAATADDALGLGTAALGLHRLGTTPGTSRREIVDWLDSARVALEDGTGSPLLARVLAALARELAAGPDADPLRATDLAHRACAVAHASGDPATVASCLLARHDVGWVPGAAAQRLAIADEATLAATSGRAGELAFEARFRRFVALLELADPQVLTEIRDLERLAAELNLPRPRYLALSRRATLALLSGRGPEAERLSDEAARFAELVGEPEGAAVHTGQRFAAALDREGWTGAAALWAELGDRAVPAPLAPVFHAMVALGNGDGGLAARVLAALPIQLDETGHPPRPHSLEVAALDVEASAAAGSLARCAAYHERLLPLASETVVLGSGIAVLGPVSLFLGLAATAGQRWDQAVGHLDDALARAERLAARPMVTRVRVRLGTALLGRDRQGDRQRARSLLSEAAEVADELGLEALRDEAVAVLAGSPPPHAARTDVRPTTTPTPHPSSEAAAAVFRRDGDVWTLRFAGRTVQLRDAKGLRDLAVLLAAPGQDILATRLIAGGDVPGQPQLGADEVLDQQARAAYKRRLADLDADIAEATAHHDPGRLARHVAERDALIGELTRAYGLGGRVRRLGDPGERARSTVTARIRDALRRIERVHPELGAHLRGSVVTGRACRYRPPAPVAWRL